MGWCTFELNFRLIPLILQLNCDGKRDRVKFVGSKEMKETHLKNDYHFLEDVLQTKGRAKRTFVKSCGKMQSIVFSNLRTSRWNNPFDVGGNKGTKMRRLDSTTNTLKIEVLDDSYQNLDNYNKTVKTLFHNVSNWRLLCILNTL
jgi:hypothetical protein